jgi:hypothetical protein
VGRARNDEFIIITLFFFLLLFFFFLLHQNKHLFLMISQFDSTSLPLHSEIFSQEQLINHTFFFPLPLPLHTLLLARPLFPSFFHPFPALSVLPTLFPLPHPPFSLLFLAFALSSLSLFHFLLLKLLYLFMVRVREGEKLGEERLNQEGKRKKRREDEK